MNVYSMTGYARVRETTTFGTIVVSLRSVNHRNLDLHLYLPSDFEPLEPEIRSAIKENVSRGHIDVRVNIEYDAAGGALRVDSAVVERYLALFADTQQKFGLATGADLNQILRFPGVMREHDDPLSQPELREAVKAAMSKAIAELNDVRAKEGNQLGDMISGCLDRARVLIDAVESERTTVLPVLHQRVLAKIHELLHQTGAAVDPQRVIQEAAFLSDRSDIAEELARLRIHCKRLKELLVEAKEVGKKIDFLMQEFNREANTILSKTNGLGQVGLEITRSGLALKAEIEKMREQALNLE
jgi:uncharacterized protein (TIGR00255 family)